MRAKTTHTPGPWFHYTGKLRPKFPTIIHEIQADDGTTLVRWSGFDGVEGSQRKISANARVMAAAAEMLDVLREVRPIIQSLAASGNVRNDAMHRKICDVIFKAEQGADIGP